jgi:hypothetical protein
MQVHGGASPSTNSDHLRQEAFSCGRALNFNKDGFYGYIDKNGKLAIPHIYYANISAQSFDENGVAVVRVEGSEGSEGLYGLIDVDGHYVVPLQECNWAEGVPEQGFYMFGNKYLDSRGNEISKKESDALNEYHSHYIYNPLQIFKTGEDTFYIRDTFSENIGNSNWWSRLFGVTNHDDEIVIDFRYGGLGWFEGCYAAAEGRFGGALNQDGTWLIKVLLDDN